MANLIYLFSCCCNDHDLIIFGNKCRCVVNARLRTNISTNSVIKLNATAARNGSMMMIIIAVGVAVKKVRNKLSYAGKYLSRSAEQYGCEMRRKTGIYPENISEAKYYSKFRKLRASFAKFQYS